jgi:20S proteasome alpha/beta subunit
MTMCLAAKADLSGEQRIVFCCDFLVSSDYASYEDVAKYDFMGTLMVMFAGPLGAAREAVKVYKNAVGATPVTFANVHSLLSDPMETYRNQIANRKRQPGQIGLLFAGFVENESRIYSVSQDGTVEERDFICAIGTGAEAAMTMLQWRGFSPDTTLQKVLYSAFEAKRISEAGVVGKKNTMLGFLEPKGNDIMVHVIPKKDLSLFDDAFNLFGPKPMTGEWHLPGRITGVIAKSLPE